MTALGGHTRRREEPDIEAQVAELYEALRAPTDPLWSDLPAKTRLLTVNVIRAYLTNLERREMREFAKRMGWNDSEEVGFT